MAKKKTKSKKSISKKPVKKPVKKSVKKPVKKIVKKPIKKVDDASDIIYAWEIVSLETHGEKGTIEHIIYEVIGVVGKGSKRRTASTTAALAVSYDVKDPYSTKDYKIFSKQEILTYIQSKISDKYIGVLKDNVSEQLFPSKKIVTKFSWNK